MMEEWRPVAGFEGLYEVSNQGRLRSLSMRNRSGIKQRLKILKPWKQSGTNGRGGYLEIMLSRNGRACHHLVHRLVLGAFHGPCPPRHEAAHQNGARTDNRAENLRWMTPQENSWQRLEHGTLHRGLQVHNARLSEGDVMAIRTLASQKRPHREIAVAFGITVPYVSKLVTGECRPHLPLVVAARREGRDGVE